MRNFSEYCGQTEPREYHEAIVIDRDWFVWIVRLCAIGLLSIALAFWFAACYVASLSKRL